MWAQMSIVAKAVAFVLFFMSMWSFGVAIERIFTFTQARNQSKMYAPQVAKHLKEGRLKDAIALSSSKNFRYSHLAKVVLAGLQEYQFQQESGGGLSREDLMDTVRRSIQRAVGADRVGPQEGRLGARDDRLDGSVRRTARHGRRRHRGVPGHRGQRVGRHRRRLGRYRGSARRDRARPRRRDSGGVVLQLPDRPHRVLQRGDGQLLVGARGLLHQEDGVRDSGDCRFQNSDCRLEGPGARIPHLAPICNLQFNLKSAI